MALFSLYWRSVQVASMLLLATVCVGVCSCDREESRRSPVNQAAFSSLAGEAASVEKALGVEAGELELRVDPPAAAGDLAAEIASFTTVDGCVDSHAHLDPLLGDALEAIGYDTFVRDACRVLDAAKARDAKRCDAIDASALRRQCATTVAAVVGDADLCPWMVASRPALGRDASCLAIASRDSRLCAAEETSVARATCEAIARHDSASCAKLPLKADQARCKRDADRWRSVTPPPAGSSPASGLAGSSPASSLAVEATLHVEGADDAGVPIDANVAPDLGRGLVVVTERGGDRFSVGPLSDSGLGFVAPSPHVQATLALELFASSDGKRVEVNRAELLVPGRSPVATPLARSTLVAKLSKLEPARGGAASLTVDGAIGDSSGTWRVHMQATTFVRDVVDARAIYASPLRAFGDAGPMR
jgi:hypothetical protein